MDNYQLMWAANSLLIIILGFFIKSWMYGIKESINNINEKLEEKVDIKTCDGFHKEISKKSHTHGNLGTAGEVIQL